ncbi:MAG: ABC transporter permease [Bacteroidia bacterium]|nr:ABC transporter permease [Bacteroidia bacterium]
MNKIGLIIQREYLTRVKRRAFIIMTILGPILMGALMVAPAVIATMEDKEVKHIQIVDQTKIIYQAIHDSKYLKFELSPDTSIEQAEKKFDSTKYYAILFIPANIVKGGNSVEIYSDKDVSREMIKHVKSEIDNEIQKEKLKANGISEDVLRIVETDINVNTFIIKEGQLKKSFTDFKMILGYIAGLIIYMFVFMFGAQVMRGVLEEKTNRIVEVIVSSVRPFQLMMGKIIGVALVGLTQFFLWVVLTFLIVTGAQTMLVSQDKFDAEKLDPDTINTISIMDKSTVTGDKKGADKDEINQVVSDALAYLNDINFPVMLGAFLFFFLAGYLLYASLFAAIGGAVDNETDTQQFMLPITIPLILAIIMLFNMVDNPNGPLAFWFSIIPFTSPVVMMARIPFGVPYWEVALSAGLLVLTFIGTTWMAGKIYRTGILMYGKKITYRELWKWLRY